MLGKDTGGGMPSLYRILELLPGPLQHSLLGKLEWPQSWHTLCPHPLPLIE